MHYFSDIMNLMIFLWEIVCVVLFAWSEVGFVHAKGTLMADALDEIVGELPVASRSTPSSDIRLMKSQIRRRCVDFLAW